MLHVEYTGRNPCQPRYYCREAQLKHGEDWCFSFEGWRPDKVVAQNVLKAVNRNRVEAALEAAEQMRQQAEARRRRCRWRRVKMKETEDTREEF